ncbi:imidazole glycerol phosphate synthase subunit HisF [Flavobacterium inviolabile]|uniref:imidazole glycerol phosphate synthase subunit HisF n=1 Tax=Flavobacterium inviolabile TaxID=2748320 RepID=UPI0015A96C1D|nr:imidazole glycerol phosphate synthase subunit HisF [Flavobacterium inviolabile]
MLTKRIIPCLDIQNGRTVKGINFLNLKDAGDPVALAKKYAENGADELVLLDISATAEERKTMVSLVRRVAQAINIPFTVGGGIRTVEDVAALLQNGADKIAINSAAIQDPDSITRLAERFGSQCVVVAIDAALQDTKWQVYQNGGKTATGLDLFSWAKEAVKRGAGEILFTSMDHDGTKNGFANEALARLSESLPVPVIASGGAGHTADFVTVFRSGKADAALAASIFHFQEITIPDLKKELRRNGIAVRI